MHIICNSAATPNYLSPQYLQSRCTLTLQYLIHFRHGVHRHCSSVAAPNNPSLWSLQSWCAPTMQHLIHFRHGMLRLRNTLIIAVKVCSNFATLNSLQSWCAQTLQLSSRPQQSVSGLQTREMFPNRKSHRAWR